MEEIGCASNLGCISDSMPKTPEGGIKGIGGEKAMKDGFETIKKGVEEGWYLLKGTGEYLGEKIDDLSWVKLV